MRKTAKEWKEIYSDENFDRTFTYEKPDLGAICTEEGTSFLLWSPFAKRVRLFLYHDGEKGSAFRSEEMSREEKGVWAYRTKEELHGMYYDFEILMEGETVRTADPYARACGVNGIRSMAVNLKRTDPEGWEQDAAPKKAEEDVIYEIHIGEFSWDESGGFPEEYRGKYKAFTCSHTTLYQDGIHPTGLDYLKDLGVTYVQLMPAYDYGSVDETKEDGEFNWGYDPVNYNVPEGSYATDAKNGEVRIREFKEMVQALHKNGFRVIMDVVYNHTYSLDTWFQRTVPWYYYRVHENGETANGSACGNDVASERSMCSRYILDSVLYWAKEYHIDGFRFDLMGLLDVELMNRIRKTLDEKYGTGEKLLFGEPWAADDSPMEKGATPALKKNIGLFDVNVGMFCDDTRDAVKGHVFKGTIPGFVNGGKGLEENILRSVSAWCGEGSPVKAPSQIISYVSAHDNWTLWDKLSITTPDQEKRMKENRLAAAIYMTCQGRVFLLSGEEFARTKEGQENTYNAPIEINRLDWKRAYEYRSLREYYKGLVGLRKKLPGICDKSENAFTRIRKTWNKDGVVSFLVDNQDTEHPSRWETLYILYNSSEKEVSADLPEGTWEILADGESSSGWTEPKTAEGSIKAKPITALILGQKGV